jgi:hypothetical protein
MKLISNKTCVFNFTLCAMLNIRAIDFFWWHFGTMPGHDLPLRGFAITLRHTTLGRTPLDKTSVRRTDPYLTTHKAHKRQTYIPMAGFEPTIPEIERTQTYNLDRGTTGIG